MPIRLSKKLPVVDTLRNENIFVMDEHRASQQMIRPLNVLIVNLMPKKIQTETQLLRLLANTPLQLNVEFIYMASHQTKNTSMSHLESFYKTFDEIQDHYYDGMIVTGAPVETLPFEEVDYWEEISAIFDWSKTHVFSTLHLCWGAQAGLYYHYDIDKYEMGEKLSGIYPQALVKKDSFLMRGFDDCFLAPHSRYTEVTMEDILEKTDLDILAAGDEVGLSILASPDLRQVYSFGHLEYDRETLGLEYERDVKAGLNPNIPVNYYDNDNPELTPSMTWNLAAATFFSNWINYAVYQETPYHLENLEDLSGLSAEL